MTADVRELTCRDVAEFVADYLAGEVTPDERRLFDEHLAECPDCVRYIRSYTETMRLAKDAYDDPLPADVPERLVRAILAARPRRK